MEKQHEGPQEASFIVATSEAEILQSDPGICTRPEEALMKQWAKEEPMRCCEHWLKIRSTATLRYFMMALENLQRAGLQGAYLRYHNQL